MAEQIIDVGTAPNNGTGDPLRTAFIKTDNNFDQIWAAGPVGSNVRIQNNVVSTLQVNQDLALSPNGVGNVRLNNNTIPGANNTWFLGSTTNQWRGVYANSITAGNVTINNNLVVPGDVTIEGNLTVEGDTIQIGNIVTDTKTIQLSNTASTANAATGSGITVGANDNIATLLYNSASNVWTTNIGITATGNITAPYFVGNGALLTGITSYSNANATSLLASFGSNTILTTGNITAGNLLAPGAVIATLLAGGNLQVTGGVSGSTVTAPGNVTGGNILTAGIVSATGNITGNYFFGNGSQLTGLPVQYGNSNVTTLLSNLGSNIISGTGNITTTGNISGGFIFGNGSQLTGLAATYGNSNVANYLPTFSGNISAGNVSATGNITGAYVKGNGSELTNLPAPAVTQDITSNGAMSIMTYDGVIKYVSYATVEPSSGNITGGNISTTGNVTANYFIGDGSQLTNLPGGNATLPLANGTSNFNIATANGSANITANAVTYTFGTDSRLTVPAAANVPGKISALTAATGRGHDLRISAGNTNGCSVAGGDMYLSAGVGYGGVGWGAGNVNIVTGDRYINDIGNTWRFDFFGNLTLPGNTFAVNYANGTPVSIGGGGNTGNVTFNDVNIIGDGNLHLQPDPANAGSYLDIFLTVGPDLHLVSNAANLILGTDEEANVAILTDGNVAIQAGNVGGTHTWNFGTDGTLTLPGNTIAINYLNGNLAFGTVTFDNEAVIGTGTSNTQSGLYLAPDPVSLANDLYLRVRGNILDEPTHIHFDTGNNQYYNQFIGDDNKYIQLANTGNIVINTNNYAGNSAQWNFDTTGNLTLPTDGYLVVTTGIIGSGASPAPSLSGFSSIATTGSPGNISASGNLLVSGYANITGNINGSNAIFSGNVTGNTAGFAIGYLNIPQVAFTANTTLTVTDAGKHYYSTLATANTLTIANNTSVSWVVGTAITVVNRGSGNITVAQGTGVSLYLAGNSSAANRTVSTYGMATLLNVAANIWMINGTGVS